MTKTDAFSPDDSMNTEQCYLIADAAHPLVSGETLQEELILYNLQDEARTSLYDKFYALTGIRLHRDYPVNNLSGGQKVILMAYLCLYSPAEKICFIDLEHALDSDNLTAIHNDVRISGKAINYKYSR
ncbi:MAG TPA: hypothetical protein PKI59_01140 [Candidatus Cloacimonadota bacterium]|nr:hypothetical protein [Candidatus Cloacimonadota bacterium]